MIKNLTKIIERGIFERKRKDNRVRGTITKRCFIDHFSFIIELLKLELGGGAYPRACHSCQWWEAAKK